LRKTFKYKAVINKATEANAIDWLYKCRTIYNLALEQKILLYKQHKVTISCYAQCKELVELKKQFPEFKVVGSQCLQDVLDRLDRGFKNFYRRFKSGKRETAGFPRFRGSSRFNSFSLKQTGWKLEGRYLYIRNVGRFKLFLSRPVEGEIKTVTIQKTPTGKWFVFFACDKVPVKEFPKTDKSVGIDVGIKSFLVDSDSNVVENPKFFRNSEKLLRRRQRRLSRRKKGSNGRKDARLLVAKAHEKVTNQRNDFLHKVANDYINQYKTISIENLKIQGLVKNSYLSKSISDASWGRFFNILSYKAECAGRTVIKVNPCNTSQNCSRCGEKVPKKLSVRIHNCPFCGLILDRDENASRNILALGQSVQASTLAMAGVA
jgi:putative transposase